MRHLPNIITISRIIVSVIILFISPHSLLFITLYIVCGLSDIADGLIARKLSFESDFGARLDSIADMVFAVVIIYKLIPVIKVPQYIIFWIVLIACMRITTMVIVKVKFHSFAVLHTWLNKLTGIILLFFPLVHNVINTEFSAGFICLIATLAATEEMIINISSKELTVDNKGIWIKRLKSSN